MFADGNVWNLISIISSDLMTVMMIIMMVMADLICVPQASIQT